MHTTDKISIRFSIDSSTPLIFERLHGLKRPTREVLHLIQLGVIKEKEILAGVTSTVAHVKTSALGPQASAQLDRPLLRNASSDLPLPVQKTTRGFDELIDRPDISNSGFFN